MTLENALQNLTTMHDECQQSLNNSRSGSVQSFNRKQFGVSLIEMVVVLTILSLAAATVSVRFAVPLQRARVESTVQQWKSLDAFARGASKSSSVTIHLQQNQSTTTATVIDQNGIIRTWACPTPTQLSVENGKNEVVPEIIYYRGLGARDYRIVVQEGTITRTIDIAGATGATRDISRKRK